VVARFSPGHSAARAWIDRRAALVGAVRLPAGAFRASDGTEAVADILILRRRPLTLGASHVPAPDYIKRRQPDHRNHQPTSQGDAR